MQVNPPRHRSLPQGPLHLANLGRTIRRLDTVPFGREFGSITLELERETNGGLAQGWQSQLWTRLREGWRIVAAHVSLLP
jgi:hypothetical protein